MAKPTIALLGLAAAAAVLGACLWPGPLTERVALEVSLLSASTAGLAEDSRLLESEVGALRAEIQRLQDALAARQPQGPYIVVDTRANQLLLRQGDSVLVETVCSAGSGRELVAGNRRWVFDTPKGIFRVTFKQRLPVWIKPDWAFYEEGVRPPLPWSPRRLEEAVLGEYALGFGQGYMIHGTLYKRLLGKNVTHGCIRLDDAPLERVYQRVRVGTPIYII